MKPLDDFQRWRKEIYGVNSTDILCEREKAEWDGISDEEKEKYLEDLLTKPVLFENPFVIYDWYFRLKWGNVLQTICKAESMSLLEIGSGCNDMLPQIISKLYNNKETRYITANMNKDLTSLFKSKTQYLPIKIDIIEDAAQKIEDYIGIGTLDVVVFEHSVNDIIEAMLGEAHGIDTTNSDWMKILPQMTEIVNREYNNKTLEKNVKKELLALFSSCMNILKSGSYIVINHYQFQYNLDIGYNPDLCENLLPIVRKWINDSNLGKEAFFENFDPQWWMFIKKV